MSEVQKNELSIGQKELWFIHSMGGAAKTAYNEHIVYELEGFLSVHCLKKAFQAVIAKHEQLRSAFNKDAQGNVFQQVHQQVALDFEMVHNVPKEEIHTVINQFISRPFDLQCPPLTRILLIKQSDNIYKLVLVVHHIIIDGTSFGIFIQDLNDFYNQILRNEQAQQVQSSTTYLAYQQAQEQQFTSQSYSEKVVAVADSLKGYSGLNFLTTPQGQDKVDIFSGNRVYFKLDKETCLKMNVFAQQHKVTAFHVLYATYCLFLSHYTRSQDIAIGVPFANREQDLERQIIGYFINTLPIRMRLQENESVVDLLARVKSLMFTRLCQQEVAFEHIAPHLQLERKPLGQHPIIQTMFVWANTAKAQLQFEGIQSHQQHNYFSETAKFDLSLFMLEQSKEEINAYFEYRDALFEKEIIQRIANNFTILLKNILENPYSTATSISLLDENEKQRIKKKYFTAKLDRIVATSMGELFSNTASKFSQHTGLVFGNNRYDYASIEKRSNQWANYIRAKYKKVYNSELGPDTLIALYVDRNEDMIFGMLGILKAGAAYVPVDPKYPHERINYIINHSQASLLLTHSVHDVKKLDFTDERIINMDDEKVIQSLEFIDQPIANKVQAQNLAYVLYTSGSTGKPKGVGVSHENIICLFESLKKQFALSSQDVWSMFHTFCFDISIWEIWGAFLFGGTLVVMPYEVTRNTKQFYQIIADEKVTVLTQTASAFQMFINEDLKSKNKLDHLRYVSFVGESLKVSILRPWVAKYGTEQPRLANMYGITETTVYTNNKFVTQTDIEKGRDNIGWPLEEFSMCVLDNKFEWCPVGIVGEICIGGRGLSRGYLYREDLTEERFIKDPYAKFLGLPDNTRLYRTGDLGRWLEDGSIEYLGRKDFQIKLRGFRIELGEIEAALGSFAGVTHTAVLLKGEGDSAYLAAYYTVKAGAEVDLSCLKGHLNAFLPEYMLPSSYTELRSFPMTINGKIDRKVLHDLEDKRVIEQDKMPLSSATDFEVAAVWADVLKIEVNALGQLSNFFELGGNSLLVIKMLTLLGNRVAKELSLSQFISMPTIATLSMQIEKGNQAQQSLDLFCKQLQKDIELDSSIQVLNGPNPDIYHPKSILLTGATGFVGAHILDELLQQTEATVYCLVRSTDSEQARKVLIAKQEKYCLYTYQNSNRIVPVVGDLSEPHLGVAQDEYHQLAKEVDAVFHIGAWVHHIYDYQTLYKANVHSVVELLNFAACVKNKSLHFVSTLATTLIAPIERLPTLDPTSLDAYLNLNGYLVTKWVAEQLIEKASGRGIAAYIYRPGNVVAGARGIYEAQTNHTLLRLKGMLQLTKGFVTSQEVVEMMPVDLLAKAIIDIARDPQQLSYNLHNSNSISWYDYLSIAKDKGYSFEFIQDQAEWNRLINNLEEHNALYKFAHLYKASTSTGEESEECPSIVPDYAITTPSYSEMIEQQFSSLIASGFLEQPSMSLG